MSFVVVAIAIWIVSTTGSNSAVGQGALVVIGTLISFVLLPDEPHRLWNVDAQSLAETVPPEKLVHAGRQIAGAMSLQAGELVPVDVLQLMWDSHNKDVARIAHNPSEVALNLDYRVQITPTSHESQVAIEIRSERYLPGIKEVMVSFCSDYDALSNEFGNHECILREQVNRRLDESPSDWVERISAYSVQLRLNGVTVPLLRVDSLTIGADDSMIVRVIYDAGGLALKFTDTRLSASWETGDKEFPVKFSSYFCVGSTNVSFEVVDVTSRISYNEYFSAAVRPINVDRMSTRTSQKLMISTLKDSVLPPGSGAVFAWTSGRTRVLQIPLVSLAEIPVGVRLPTAGDLPTTRRPADDIVDPLTDLTGLRMVDAYSLLGILPARQFRVRTSVLERLHRANAGLPDGYELVVLDAWRSRDTQRALLDYYALGTSGSSYVASLRDDGMRPPHLTGGAVDVTVAWRGVPLALGTDYDSFDPSAHFGAFESSDGVPRRLRRMLAAAMMGAGFAPYPFEWWHWSYGDDVWAEFEKASTVRFDLIDG